MKGESSRDLRGAEEEVVPTERLDKLMGFLGKSEYKKTCYYIQGPRGDEEKRCDTEYVIEALARFLKPEKVVLFLTGEARASHERAIRKTFEGMGVALQIVDITDPQNDREIWRFFRNFTDQVKRGESVAIDITHAFRHFQVIAFQAVLYLREIKEAKIKGIYYGHFTGGEDTPIFDLTPALSLADWLYHTREFMNYYRGEALAETIKEEHRVLYQKNLQPKYMQKMARHLEEFSKNFRLGLTLSSLDSAHSLVEVLPSFKEELTHSVLPLQEIVTRLESLKGLEYPKERVENVGINLEFIKKMHDLAELQSKRGYPALSIATMRENLVNMVILIISRYGNDGTKWLDKSNREPAERILGGFLKMKRGEKYDKVANFDEVYNYLLEKGIFDNLVDLWNRVSDLRNKLAHCEMSTKSPKFTTVERSCKEFLTKERKLLERIEEDFR